MSDETTENSENIERKIKITVIKLLEISYSDRKAATLALVGTKGPFQMRIDQNGDVEVSGKKAHFKIKGKPVLDEMGLDLKAGSIMFSNAGDNRLNYTIKAKVGVVDVEYHSMINVEELLLSCSGLLCRAARALKDRTNQIDRSLQGLQ